MCLQNLVEHFQYLQKKTFHVNFKFLIQNMKFIRFQYFFIIPTQTAPSILFSESKQSPATQQITRSKLYWPQCTAYKFEKQLRNSSRNNHHHRSSNNCFLIFSTLFIQNNLLLLPFYEMQHGSKDYQLRYSVMRWLQC